MCTRNLQKSLNLHALQTLEMIDRGKTISPNEVMQVMKELEKSEPSITTCELVERMLNIIWAKARGEGTTLVSKSVKNEPVAGLIRRPYSIEAETSAQMTA